MKPAYRRALILYLLPAALVVAGCGRSVDLKQTLHVSDISGGWFDAGVVAGKNKLVPSVTFRINKPADITVRPLSLNLSFKKITAGGEEEFDDAYLQTVEFAEPARTAPLTVRTEHGYTADPPQTRAQMLQHSQFQDVRVVIFAKQSSSNWVELARYDLPRQLLTK